MPIYDISLTISNDLPVWPGDTPISLVRNKDMHDGELYTLSQLTTTVQVGSHLDAPRHFVRDGHGVDQIDLHKLIGPCFVVHLPDIDGIDAASLEQANIPGNVTRLLCRTRNSEYWARGDKRFKDDFFKFTPPSGARVTEE